MSQSTSSNGRSSTWSPSEATSATSLPDIDMGTYLVQQASNPFGNNPIDFNVNMGGESEWTLDFRHDVNGLRVVKTSKAIIQNSTEQPVNGVQDSGKPVEQTKQKAGKSHEELERRIHQLEQDRNDLKSKNEEMRATQFIQQAQLHAKDKELQKFRDKLVTAESKIENMKATQATQNTQLLTKNKELRELKGTIVAAEEEQAKIAERNHKLRNSMNNQSFNLRKLSNLSDEADKKRIPDEEEEEEKEYIIQRLDEDVKKTRDKYQSLEDDNQCLRTKSENQEKELNAKDAEIQRYKQAVTRIAKKYKTKRDQAAEAQTQNDNLKQENQALSTQLQLDLQNLQAQVEERNMTLNSQKRRIYRLQARFVIQQFRNKVLTRKYNQLQRQQNNITEHDDMWQRTGPFVQEYNHIPRQYGQYLVHQMYTPVERIRFPSLVRQITTPSSTEANLEMLSQCQTNGPQTSTDRRRRVTNRDLMRLVRKSREIFSEAMTRSGQWRETVPSRHRRQLRTVDALRFNTIHYSLS